MLRWQHDSGVGPATVQIPGGQLLDITMIPDHDLGSILQIGNAQPVYVPAGHTFELGANELGNCCGSQTCDQFPGEMPIILRFGVGVLIVDDREVPLGPPQAWFVAWRGC